MFEGMQPSQTQKANATASLSSIRLPLTQPRRYFDPEKLKQLAASVKEHGIIEPLLVRPMPDGGYELVAGERRYRAAQEIGLEAVPIVVRELNDDEALQLALVENLQREDLNPVEETEGILQLLALRLNVPVEKLPSVLYRLENEAKGKVTPNVGGKQDIEVVESLFNELGGLSWRSFVKHKLPLLNLPSDIMEALRQGKLNYTKAQAIAQVKDEKSREALLKDSIAQSLSLTQIKDRVKALRPPKKPIEALQSRWDYTTKRIKKAKLWSDPDRSKKLERLLEAMDKLLEEE